MKLYHHETYTLWNSYIKWCYILLSHSVLLRFAAPLSAYILCYSWSNFWYKKTVWLNGWPFFSCCYRHSSFTSCLFFKYVSELDSSLVEYANPAAVVAAGPTAVAAVSSSSVKQCWLSFIWQVWRSIQKGTVKKGQNKEICTLWFFRNWRPLCNFLLHLFQF